MSETSSPLNQQFLSAVSQLDGIGIRNAIEQESNKSEYLSTLNNLISTSSSLYFLYQMSFLFADHFSDRVDDRKVIIKRMIELCDSLDDVEKTLDAVSGLSNAEDKNDLRQSTTEKSALLNRLKREREETHKQLYRYMSNKTLTQFKTLESLRSKIKAGRVEILTSQDGVVESLRTFCADIGAKILVEESGEEIEPWRKALGEIPKKVTMWM